MAEIAPMENSEAILDLGRFARSVSRGSSWKQGHRLAHGRVRDGRCAFREAILLALNTTPVRRSESDAADAAAKEAGVLSIYGLQRAHRALETGFSRTAYG